MGTRDEVAEQRMGLPRKRKRGGTEGEEDRMETAAEGSRGREGFEMRFGGEPRGAPGSAPRLAGERDATQRAQPH